MTTATLAYQSYCTTDTSTGERTTMNGSIPFVNTATPTSSGPISTRLEAGSPGGVSLIARNSGGTVLTSQAFSFNNFVEAIGVPGGVSTASNPDRLTLGDLTVTDNVSGKTYRETNYAVTSFTTSTGGQQYTIGGRGYRSNGDYFDISTTSPLVSDSGGRTLGGEITVNGATGSTVVMTLVPGGVLQATMKVNGTTVTSVPTCR